MSHIEDEQKWQKWGGRTTTCQVISGRLTMGGGRPATLGFGPLTTWNGPLTTSLATSIRCANKHKKVKIQPYKRASNISKGHNVPGQGLVMSKIRGEQHATNWSKTRGRPTT